jgi:hypothetical protein
MCAPHFLSTPFIITENLIELFYESLAFYVLVGRL